MGGGTGASQVDILILGAGWTATFLIPLLEAHKVSYAATSTTGRDDTIKFKLVYDSKSGDSDSLAQYAHLPIAKTILIVFPLVGVGQSRHLRESYVKTHPDVEPPAMIQLGSVGNWFLAQNTDWVTRHSPYDHSPPRVIAEDELLTMGNTCVLNLAGLWGGVRDARHLLDRLDPSREDLRDKLKALPMIHGRDVARAILAVHQDFDSAVNQRWLLTDLMVYDWWSLVLRYAGEKIRDNEDDKRASSQVTWVRELMSEQQIRGLPRTQDTLGRCLDSREFWTTFDIMPIMSGLR